MTIGLVTGSLPFAGLPDSPSTELIGALHGRSFGGVTIHAETTRVSLKEIPVFWPALIRKHRPAFVVALGLATGAPVLRVETSAINRVSFATADNDGDRPTDGRPTIPGGPPARAATWDGPALVRALLDADLPAVLSFFAGTHLCNATLYTALAAMEDEGLSGPVGFFHLPYLPSQVARFLRDAPPEGDLAPFTTRALPSMGLADQVRAAEVLLETLAGTLN